MEVRKVGSEADAASGSESVPPVLIVCRSEARASERTHLVRAFEKREQKQIGLSVRLPWVCIVFSATAFSQKRRYFQPKGLSTQH